MAKKKKTETPAEEVIETAEEKIEEAREEIKAEAAEVEAEVEKAEEAATEEAKEEADTVKEKVADATETAKAKAAEATEAAKVKASEAKEDAKETAEKIKKKWNSAEDHTGEYDKKDIEANKYYSLLGYFGILVLIPLIFAAHSRFAKFHANQALVLLIVRMTYVLFTGCITAIISLSSCGFAVFIGLIFALCYLVLFILWVQGIANAADGKAKELPFIGTWELLDLD